MNIFKMFSLFILYVLFTTSAIAQDIISAAELSKIYTNDDVVVVWAGKSDDYKVHITGSINLPHTSLYKDGAIKNLLKSTSEISAILSENGISNNKTIVVYDEGSGKYSGRMYWILKYLGAQNVKMLDGNMKAWKSLRKPITGAPTQIKKSTFTAKPDAGILASNDDVKKAIGNSAFILLDVRAADEFAGTAESTIRKGHIPGSINIEFSQVLNSKGELKSKDELKTLFESKGITANKTIITFCESSVRAGVVFLALKSALGYPNVKVYDGAFYEWQATASNAVE